jgi:hypothetical protein
MIHRATLEQTSVFICDLRQCLRSREDCLCHFHQRSSYVPEEASGDRPNIRIGMPARYGSCMQGK